MTSPRVSVVLPTYNRAATLRRAIGSVLAQTFGDLELIVVDDGSTDETAAIVAAIGDPRIVYTRHGRPSGVSAARNAGVAIARGELIAFQDSDDEWLLEKLARQVELIDRLGPEYALVGGTALRYIGGPLISVRWPLAGEGPDVDREAFLNGLVAYMQSALFRRTCLQAVGGFDETMSRSEDWELCLRLMATHRLAAIADPVVVSYEMPGSLTAQHDLKRVALRYALAKHADLLAAHPPAHANVLFEIAKADFYCGETADGRRATLKAAMLQPLRMRAWLLLAASLFGGSLLMGGVSLYRRTKFRLNLYR
ncbi:MAG TPA: glycosyltransferase [Nevskiaceae bacterium]|nr:glycosyltransferase [Nevskiaceae bacterium]